MIRLRVVTRAAIACAILAPAANAQHTYSPAGAQYDARVPRPSAVLGYDVGERFTPHHMVMRYFERVAQATRRVKLDTLGATFEGREYITAVVTSERNQQRLAQILQDAKLLGDPRNVSQADLDAALGRMPTIVLLAHTIHGGEASGTEASLATLYQLAAATDPATLAMLDSVVVLVDPIQNPDGHERHAQDVMRRRGAFGADPVPGAMINGGTWPGARTSHYHFDLNRDWFIQSHAETRARVEYFFKWWPHTVVDLHEMGSNSTYFFAPPMEPYNKNVPPSVLTWWEMFAAANARAFDAYGQAYFRREGYDEFYPGYGVSWPILSGAIGMTYEEASSSGGAVRRTDGTVLTLSMAARNHYTAGIATVMTAARNRAQRLRDYMSERRSNLTVAAGALRSIWLERDAAGRADSLAVVLGRNMIQVAVHNALPADAVPYPQTAGARPAQFLVVDLAQPQGRLAKALLEPDAQLDSSFIRDEIERRRTAQPNRFYDITAWSLPMAFGVRAWTSRSAPMGLFANQVRPTAGTVTGGRAAHAYAFAPGSEASLRMLSVLFADSIRVSFAPRAFKLGVADFPKGAFIVRVASNGERVHDAVTRAARASGVNAFALASALVETGTDLGSNSVFPMRAPNVAMLGGESVNGNSFGFAWYAFDQRIAYPVTRVEANFVSGGGLSDFNVFVIPSANGLPAALGEEGVRRLQQWVRDGGTLITLEAATSWLATPASGLGRLRARAARDSGAAGSGGRGGAATEGGTLSASVPGALLRVDGDTLSPLLAGVDPTRLAALVNGDRSLDVPRDLRPQEAVLRMADRDRLRLSGYLWPESWDRQARSVYVWTERVGRGRIVGFAGDPNYRDLMRGLLPVFGNAVFFNAAY
ncbi:MAG TPA: M14 family zinc carboxypeptidase [Gemmatimonadaceae bacterium]|nr:M14 family zinc carboxypeptidase [Gemmatimonadaceae bacterium]